MRIWVDTEFMEDGEVIELLSVGMIREDGETLYLEASWADRSHANGWVVTHVLPHLLGDEDITVDRDEMRRMIVKFAGADPDFWAWFAAYDWVAICQLFGKMVDLPSTWPQRINDVAQVAQMVGANRLPQQTSVAHNALSDAMHARALHLWLETMYSAQLP
jgi:hypothetical protein